MSPAPSRTSGIRDFLLPDLGEGLTEAEVLRWLVEVGDTVVVDQPVAEVETAKTAVEVPCPYAGQVAELHSAPGATVSVGAALISIAVDTGAAEGFSDPGTVVPPARTGETPADPGGGGDDGAAGSAAAGEGTAEGSGAVLVGYGTREGARRVNRRRGSGAPNVEESGTTGARAPSSRREPSARTPVVSPLVRRMAREYGVDVTSITGSGEGGLVLRRDVAAAIGRQIPAAPDTVSSENAPAPQRPQPQRIALRGSRRSAAERMARSRREIPEATVWVDADVTELLAARRLINTADPDRPVSILALLARFCVIGLGRFPGLNAQVDTERSELVRFGHVNLGFAAQTPRGLMVPVVADAHTMSARRLSKALSGLTAQARAGALRPEQLTGGTITLNNYGVFGVDGSAAIINHPEAAIVGLGRIVKRPWVVEDALAVRQVAELTLAFDHRVCDGEEAGGFLRFVADCVEHPQVLLADI